MGNGNFQIYPTFTFKNKNSAAASFNDGVRLMKDDETVQDFVWSNSSTNIASGAGYSSGQTIQFGNGLADGTYRLIGISQCNGDSWLPCNGSDECYVECVISGNTLTTTVHIPTETSPQITVTSINIGGALALGQAQTISVGVSNDGSGDYHGDITIAFSYTVSGVTKYDKFGGKTIDLAAGESTTVDITAAPAKVGTFTLCVFDGFFGSGTLKATSSNVTVNSGEAAANIAFSEIAVNNSSSKTVYGNAISGSVKVTNNASTSYKQGISVFVGKTYNWTDLGNGQWRYSYSIEETKNVNDVLSAGASTTIDFDFKGLEYGELYVLMMSYYTYSGTSAISHQNKGGVYTISHGFVIVDAAGNVTASAPTSSVTVPAGAVAVDLRGQSTVTSVTANSNPNTVYLLDAGAAVPTGVSGNIVKGDAAETITLTDGNDFKTPVAFTAGTVSYSRTFTQGSTGTGGWSTLILPFDVETVTVGGETIDWFHTADATNGRFWVRKFVSDGAGTVAFDYTDKIEANTPYIIAVPGNTWGEQYDLRGKTLVFSGTNKSVSSTNAVTSGNHYKMIGSTVTTNQSRVYDLNAGGSSFVLGDAQIAPFRAYFKASDIAYATTALQITSPGSGTTAVGQLPAAIALPEAVYSLDGRRLTVVPAHGVYIKNGKKYVK
jgi:hypothetical protein